MPQNPKYIWKNLTPQIQQQIRHNLSMICQELSDEFFRMHNLSTPGTQGAHLHTSINPESSDEQSGKSAAAAGT
jgi:hypothetical protein